MNLFRRWYKQPIIIYQSMAAVEQIQKQAFQFMEGSHSKHLSCKVCFQLMLEPVRLNQCGHTFCSQCVQDKSVKKCPLCLQNIKDKQKDILASRLVGELKVKCKHAGCPWQGPFMEYRTFHKSGCRLREGGMEEWLKRVEESISLNKKFDPIQPAEPQPARNEPDPSQEQEPSQEPGPSQELELPQDPLGENNKDEPLEYPSGQEEKPDNKAQVPQEHQKEEKRGTSDKRAESSRKSSRRNQSRQAGSVEYSEDQLQQILMRKRRKGKPAVEQ